MQQCLCNNPHPKCRCNMSMQHVDATCLCTCPCSMSMQHVYAAMSMQHADATCRCHNVGPGRWMRRQALAASMRACSARMGGLAHSAGQAGTHRCAATTMCADTCIDMHLLRMGKAGGTSCQCCLFLRIFFYLFFISFYVFIGAKQVPFRVTIRL